MTALWLPAIMSVTSESSRRPSTSSTAGFQPRVIRRSIDSTPPRVPGDSSPRSSFRSRFPGIQGDRPGRGAAFDEIVTEWVFWQSGQDAPAHRSIDSQHAAPVADRGVEKLLDDLVKFE